MTERAPSETGETDEIEETLIAYARTPVEFRRVTAGMRDADALQVPAEGEWSVAQIVAHLWTVDGHALVAFAGAAPPEAVVMEPRNPPTFGPLMDAFELRRVAVVAALRNLPADLWDAPFTFRGFERTARQLVTGFVRHDADHLQQIITTRTAVEGKGQLPGDKEHH